jgi:hypothetical protein
MCAGWYFVVGPIENRGSKFEVRMESVDERGDVTSHCTSCTNPIDGVKQCHPAMRTLCASCADGIMVSRIRATGMPRVRKYR